MLSHAGGPLRLLGGPGTGKTTLLAEWVARRVLAEPLEAERVLVLTTSRRAAIDLRARITRRVTAAQSGAGLRAIREPLVRTVHSYAFAVLRAQAALWGMPAPRLLAGADQDAIFRELLAGDIELGADYWPARLRPALELPEFAAELRDLLLRAAERDVSWEGMIEIGRRHGRDEWVAAGLFARQYERVMALRAAGGGVSARDAAPALDAAELVTSALLAFDTDAELCATQRARVAHLVVDDAQHLDPQQFALISRLGSSARDFVLAGDPDQAVFSFRGADPRLLPEADPDGDRTVVLTVDHRMAGSIRDAVCRLTERLPGTGPHRDLRGPDHDGGSRHPGEGGDGRVDVRVFASAAQEAAWVADQLRRAHLLHGVPWSRMAVLVRSATRTLPVLRRALLAAGVPLSVAAETQPIARNPVVRPFLDLLRAAGTRGTLDEDTAAALVTGPLGGADPLALRRVRRGLRRLELASGGERSSGELLVEAMESTDALAALDPSESQAVRRVADLVRLARDAVAEGASVEQVLWRLWTASGLAQRLAARSARGGPVGAQADHDLDAVLVLFDAAAGYVDRLPGSGVEGFADYLNAQLIAGDSLAPAAPRGESVAVLTAHAAAGREWSVVAVASVQEGVWPDLRSRGSLLGVEKLVDLLSGVDPASAVSVTAPLLAEERRLFRLAISRARDVVLVSAVRGEDEQPSRFLDELVVTDGDLDLPVHPVSSVGRALAAADVVGELRRVVCSDAEPESRRRRAARQLARLAAANVPGAHPRSWYGLPEVSSSQPLWSADDEVRVSPSTVEWLTRCPLRWLVERLGGTDSIELPSLTGTLVHALAQAAAEGADAEALKAALDRAWVAVDAGAPWFSRREKQRVERMVDTFRSWLACSRFELTQVAVEQDVDIRPQRSPGGPWLRIRGRVDRLEVDVEGRPVIVDIKTAKSPVSAAEAARHPQLALYQLAVALGAFDRDGLPSDPGGARLLYVAEEHSKTGAVQRVAPPLSDEDVVAWLEVVRDAARACTGPEYTASENADCSRCPARTCCPVHESGRQVGG